MTKTAFPPAIRSRPVYGVLEPRPGRAHLIIADGEGAGAIVDLIARAGDAAQSLREQAQVIYVTGANGTDMSVDLAALGLAQLYHAPTLQSVVPRIQKVLAEAHMGLQIYLAGTEGLIGIARREVERAGLPFEAVQTEHRGSLARRVQCVHCKGVTENVTTDPFQCSHCGLNLFVRDHYSRRIAAFQGVNIDAEDPGQVPEPEVKFP
ncbi:dimethylamine monooxygenase subunit DmmA family protein [Paracoccus pacificus]|uniref:Dimethylamine monooxygenase subunit DmmA family protein n=1 Tax=Paracoccus pacificus TaxID=1463598 RepID=A0ABW4R5U0_9RHOB